MDYRHPIEAVIPGVQGKVLRALLRTSGELNLRDIARVAGVSIAQASRVLPELVSLGIIERREVPPSSLFQLVPEHLATRALIALSTTRQDLIAEIGRTAAHVEPSPVSVVAFGSFARDDGSAESDIDLVVVRPRNIDEDDERWLSSLDAWRNHISRVAGNDIEVLEVGEDEIAAKLKGAAQVWRDIRRDGHLLHGKPLTEIAEPANASAHAHQTSHRLASAVARGQGARIGRRGRKRAAGRSLYCRHQPGRACRDQRRRRNPRCPTRPTRHNLPSPKQVPFQIRGLWVASHSYERAVLALGGLL